MRLIAFSTMVLTLMGGQLGYAARFDVIIDDAQAEFSSWNTGLQEGAGNNSYMGGYRYVEGWGALEGTGQESALVTYRLPPGINFPSGERLYNIYAWMPDVPWEWHIIDVNADGSGAFPHQQISWPGQFGTNRQWIAADPGKPFDSELGGRWLKLGPGPQTPNGGDAVLINPDVPLTEEPSLFIKYQPFYNGLIAFDAIRIIEVPLAGDYNGNGVVDAADYIVWRNSLGTMGEGLAADGSGNGEIDMDDYTFWKDRFGLTAADAQDALLISGGAAIPEPTAGIAGLLASVALISLRRRCR